MSAADYFTEGRALMERAMANDVITGRGHLVESVMDRAELLDQARTLFAAALVLATVEMGAQQSVNGMPDAWCQVLRTEWRQTS